MPTYLTTREVAALLRLAEKRVYALVAAGQLPAARISGKWLFPEALVHQWVAEHTTYPAAGLMGALLEDLVVIQGSDDAVFGAAAERHTEVRDVPVVSARVGSLAGLTAISRGRAHGAGCHVGNEQVRGAVGRDGCYLIHLFDREQGLLIERARHPGVEDLARAAAQGLRLAGRQPLSGTHRLAEELLRAGGVEAESVAWLGPFASHLGLALAIRQGRADAGLGVRLAAVEAGLDFFPLATEPYKLAIPAPLFGHPRIASFVELVLDTLAERARAGVAGYDFTPLGRIESITPTSSETDSK